MLSNLSNSDYFTAQSQSQSERITLSDESNPSKWCCTFNLTVRNYSVCVFLTPNSWIGVCFWFLWVAGLSCLALGLYCIIEQDGYDVCGDTELGSIIMISVGGVFSLLTVPLCCFIAICTEDNY